jgi:hypothetical protein
VEKAADTPERMAERYADAENVGKMKHIRTPDDAPYGKRESSADEPAVKYKTSVPYLKRGGKVAVKPVFMPVLNDVGDASADQPGNDQSKHEIGKLGTLIKLFDRHPGKKNPRGDTQAESLYRET